MYKTDNLSQNIFEQQIEALFKTTQTGGLANIFSAWLVYAMLYDSHGKIVLTLALIISALSAFRIITSNLYLKNPRNDETISYLTIYLVLTVLIGISWAGIIVVQSLQSNTLVSSIIYLINFGLIAGSLVTLSAWFPAYIAFVAPQSLAIFGVLAVQNHNLSIYYALAFLVFISIMTSGSYRFCRSFVSNLTLKMDLMESRSDLEEKVRQRTTELIETNDQLRKEIADKNKARRELEYLAFNDELTGLPKKNVLIDRANTAIISAKRNGSKMALLFLDLDGFKKVNDTLGHEIGDKLIKEVSSRLTSVLREDDTISRNGGDEFVVLIKNMVDLNTIIKITNKLIDSVSKNFIIDSHKIHIGVSIGVSVYPNDGEDGTQLLKNADTAMYSAKKHGGNQFQFYDKSMSLRLVKRLMLEAGLHSALEKDELYLVYQPQFDIHTNSIVGYEALLRWKRRGNNQISPAYFVPLMEDTGLIYEIGKWVIQSVIEQIALNTTKQLPVSINISPLQCRDLTLIDFIDEEIRNAVIDSSLLDFEITESLLIKDVEKTEEFLNRLHQIGCTVTLDDFGTGYTSMNYLTMLPIDKIKIDQCFVRGIDKKEKLQDIVSAMINMCESLGISTIIEGVETQEELMVVKRLQGKVVQGFFYSKPLTVEEMVVKKLPNNVVHL